MIDFFCAAAKLGVELDGAQHATVNGQARDSERSEALAAHGIRILRFSNAEVINDVSDVAARILIDLATMTNGERPQRTLLDVVAQPGVEADFDFDAPRVELAIGGAELSDPPPTARSRSRR